MTAPDRHQLDPWEPLNNRRSGHHRLTSVEITTTNRCNLRCRHCAVGETLGAMEPGRLPLDQLLSRLDAVESLTTLSITGGEPCADLLSIHTYVLPLLKYAHERGLKTQVNTNLTYDLARYEAIAPWIDVLHTTWNYRDVDDFHAVAWGQAQREVSPGASAALFERVSQNIHALAGGGLFVSAESMVNRETAAHLGGFNRMLASLGCRRHEVHPMYPVDWAATLPVLPLDDYRAAVERLLIGRDPALWLLFGTFPCLPCSPDPDDRQLWRKACDAANVTIRNCPDGRNRVNINAFTGDVFVTDFAALPALGNVRTDDLTTIFERWQQHEAFAPFNCFCAEAGCTGPNLLVAHTYHPGVDFRQRRAQV